MKKKYAATNITLPNADDDVSKIDIFKLTRAANKAWKHRRKNPKHNINLTKLATALELAQ